MMHDYTVSIGIASGWSVMYLCCCGAKQQDSYSNRRRYSHIDAQIHHAAFRGLVLGSWCIATAVLQRNNNLWTTGVSMTTVVYGSIVYHLVDFWSTRDVSLLLLCKVTILNEQRCLYNFWRTRDRMLLFCCKAATDSIPLKSQPLHWCMNAPCGS